MADGARVPAVKLVPRQVSCNELDHERLLVMFFIFRTLVVCHISSKNHLYGVCDFRQNFTTETAISLNEACPIGNYSAPVVFQQEENLASSC